MGVSITDDLILDGLSNDLDRRRQADYAAAIQILGPAGAARQRVEIEARREAEAARIAAKFAPAKGGLK